MPSFSLYPQTRSGLIGRIISVASGSIGGATTSYLDVYGGVPPTKEEFAVMTRTTVPTAGKLITFNITGTAATGGKLTNIPPATAAVSGMATWFVLRCTTVDPMIMGDITDVAGSGALRLNDVNIVAGKTYSTQNIIVLPPLTYEF